MRCEQISSQCVCNVWMCGVCCVRVVRRVRKRNSKGSALGHSRPGPADRDNLSAWRREREWEAGSSAAFILSQPHPSEVLIGWRPAPLCRWQHCGSRQATVRQRGAGPSQYGIKQNIAVYSIYGIYQHKKKKTSKIRMNIFFFMWNTTTVSV